MGWVLVPAGGGSGWAGARQLGGAEGAPARGALSPARTEHALTTGREMRHRYRRSPSTAWGRTRRTEHRRPAFRPCSDVRAMAGGVVTPAQLGPECPGRPKRRKTPAPGVGA